MPPPMTLIVVIVIAAMLLIGLLILGRSGVGGRESKHRDCPKCGKSNRAEAKFCGHCGDGL